MMFYMNPRLRILIKEIFSVSSVSRAKRVVNQFGPFRAIIMPPFLGVVFDSLTSYL
jgi:hypothetical protein